MRGLLPTVLLPVLAVLASGCGAPSPSPAAPPGWADSLRQYRVRVDEFFRSEESPLLAAQKEAFHGLSWYPLDPAWRFTVRPDLREAGRPATLLDTQGNERRYLVHCRLPLEKDGVRFTLTVFRSAGGDHLFLPFQDATTGGETYAVGRYLDLAEGPDGTLVVDFNAARNPYCAYNDRWACPLVPPENRIPLAVRAGERAFHP